MEWQSDMDPTEGKCMGFITHRSDEGSPRLIFVFSSGGNPSAEHQMGTLRGNSPCIRVGTPIGRNPTTEDFDSRRSIEKVSVGKSALSSPSGKNLISRAYRHNPPGWRNPNSGRTDSEWRKSQQGSNFEWRKSH